MTIEVIAEIAVAEECGEPGIGIGKVPGLDRRHQIVRRDSKTVTSPAPDAHFRHDAMAEILVVPVKRVGTPDDSHHRRV